MKGLCSYREIAAIYGQRRAIDEGASEERNRQGGRLQSKQSGFAASVVTGDVQLRLERSDRSFGT